MSGSQGPDAWQGEILTRAVGGACATHLMPVRAAIHSSLVSTSFSRSALVSTASGTLLPDPASLQPATMQRAGF